MVFRPSIATRGPCSPVCIEEPQHDGQARRSELLNGGGFAYWDNHMPAMYLPVHFSVSCNCSPEDGLTTILRLVDFATNRWQEASSVSTGPMRRPGSHSTRRFRQSYAGDGTCTNGTDPCEWIRLRLRAPSWPWRSGLRSDRCEAGHRT